jgi:hypothetical protein
MNNIELILGVNFWFYRLLPVSQMQYFCNTLYEEDRSSPGSRAVASKHVTTEYCYISTDQHVYRQRMFENGCCGRYLGLRVGNKRFRDKQIARCEAA